MNNQIFVIQTKGPAQASLEPGTRHLHLGHPPTRHLYLGHPPKPKGAPDVFTGYPTSRRKGNEQRTGAPFKTSFGLEWGLLSLTRPPAGADTVI
jgi:hypothetical protein